jgi:spermidine synthase
MAIELNSTTWTTEVYNHVGFSLETTETLFEECSEFQRISVVDTKAYGRLLLLDGAVMTTDKDEFVYHEMITHVPMMVHPRPKRVLVIGGGDGGTIRELMKHPEVEEAVLCEIDGKVVEACKTFFPYHTSRLTHPKVTVYVGDGVAYMAEAAEAPHKFDVIIIDSTDPVGPGEGLFTETFYRHCFSALNEDGILVAQTESPFLSREVIEKVYPLYQRIFPIVNMYTGHIPTYPSGFWTWAFCSKRYEHYLSNAHSPRITPIVETCQYYNAELHNASFVLPNFVKQLVAKSV